MSLLLLVGLTAPPADGFEAVSPGDDRPVGRLVRVADGSAVLRTAAGPVEVRDLVSLRRVDTAPPPFPRGPVLLTTTGDRLPGRLVGGDAKTLRFEPTGRGEWTVPAAAVAAVWLTRPPADTPADVPRYPWLADRKKRDVVLFRNGDTRPGTVNGFAADPLALRLKPDAGEARAVPLDEVAAVAFNPALARTRKPKGPYAALVLRDGTRLSVHSLSADETTLRGTTLYGVEVKLPTADLVRLDVSQGKAVGLSTLTPSRVEQGGFLGTAWPWAADRSVRGQPIRLRTAAGDASFDRGLGTHPRTVLTYDLGGRYRRFEAEVGIDPAAGTRGRAAVKVLVDGKEQPVPTLAELTAGEAVPVRLDVRGANSLTLVVDFGPAGGVQADVNWADAKLIE